MEGKKRPFGDDGPAGDSEAESHGRDAAAPHGDEAESHGFPDDAGNGLGATLLFVAVDASIGTSYKGR